MSRIRSTSVLVLAVVVCVAGAAFAAKKVLVTADTFRGKEPAEAAAALLAAAREEAGKGTYERIAVGRVHYLTGDREAGRALFDAVLADREAGPADWIRIARVYREAGDLDEALPLYERVADAKPKDEDYLAEAGSAFVLAGRRERGEELLARSFELDPNNLTNSLNAASGYLGLKTLR